MNRVVFPSSIMNASSGTLRMAWPNPLLPFLRISLLFAALGLGVGFAQEEKPPEGLIPCRILLDNGDRTRVMLDGLTPEILSWRYVFAPDQRVEVKQGRVKRIEFTSPVGETDDDEEGAADVAPRRRMLLDMHKETLRESPDDGSEGDDPAGGVDDADALAKPKNESPLMRLSLHSETQLNGRFDRLTDTSLFFQPVGSDLIEFPRTEVSRLTQSGVTPKNEKALNRANDKHLVLTETAALQGDLVQSGTWLQVESTTVKGEVAVDVIQDIRFPVSGAFNEPLNEAPKDQLNCHVVLQDKGKVQGVHPWMDPTNLTMTILNGPDIVIPMRQLVSINFSVGVPTQSKRVLVWGQFADEDEELRNTIEAVQAGDERWSFTTHNHVPAGAEFREALLASRVLLIPEMESYDDSKLRQNYTIDGDRKPLETFVDREFAPLLKTYLRRGGRVIICHPGEKGLGFLKRLEIFPEITLAANSETKEVFFTEAGKALSKDIGKSFMTTDATSFYTLEEGAAALATSDTGCPIFISRHDKGFAAVLGMDYYDPTPETQRVIQNLFTIP